MSSRSRKPTPFDRLLKQQCQKGVAASKSAGFTVGKWGTASFTSMRSGGDGAAGSLNGGAGGPPPTAKPKKFFKSRQKEPVVQEEEDGMTGIITPVTNATASSGAPAASASANKWVDTVISYQQQPARAPSPVAATPPPPPPPPPATKKKFFTSKKRKLQQAEEEEETQQVHQIAQQQQPVLSPPRENPPSPPPPPPRREQRRPRRAAAAAASASGGLWEEPENQAPDDLDEAEQFLPPPTSSSTREKRREQRREQRTQRREQREQEREQQHLHQPETQLRVPPLKLRIKTVLPPPPPPPAAAEASPSPSPSPSPPPPPEADMGDEASEGEEHPASPAVSEEEEDSEVSFKASPEKPREMEEVFAPPKQQPIAEEEEEEEEQMQWSKAEEQGGGVNGDHQEQMNDRSWLSEEVQQHREKLEQELNREQMKSPNREQMKSPSIRSFPSPPPDDVASSPVHEQARQQDKADEEVAAPTPPSPPAPPRLPSPPPPLPPARAESPPMVNRSLTTMQYSRRAYTRTKPPAPSTAASQMSTTTVAAAAAPLVQPAASPLPAPVRSYSRRVNSQTNKVITSSSNETSSESCHQPPQDGVSERLSPTPPTKTTSTLLSSDDGATLEGKALSLQRADTEPVVNEGSGDKSASNSQPLPVVREESSQSSSSSTASSTKKFFTKKRSIFKSKSVAGTSSASAAGAGAAIGAAASGVGGGSNGNGGGGNGGKKGRSLYRHNWNQNDDGGANNDDDNFKSKIMDRVLSGKSSTGQSFDEFDDDDFGGGGMGDFAAAPLSASEMSFSSNRLVRVTSNAAAASSAAAAASGGNAETASGGGGFLDETAPPEVVSVKCPKAAKGYYTVIKHVKKAHQIQDSGEFQEFNDDVDYILEGLGAHNSLSTRCLSTVTLASKCMEPAFRMHLRAHGTVTKFFGELRDAPDNASLALCTATVLFVLSQDRLNMDLDRDSLELMLNLLDTDSRIKDALDGSGMNARELAKNKAKVEELCLSIKSKGRAANLNLDNISADHLSMETLLSLTSKRAGEWFKEELRELGGLDHLVRTMSDCLDYLSADEISIWTEPLHHKLKKADRVLKVLESVTYENEENCTYLLDHQNGKFLHLIHNLFKLLDEEMPLNPSTDNQDKESISHTLLESLLDVIRVHINLVHDYKQIAFGSRLSGEKDGIFDMILHCMFVVPDYIPEQKRFDILVLSLTLTINLVEHCKPNRTRLMKTLVPEKAGDLFAKAKEERETAPQRFVKLFLVMEESAKRLESKTDKILDGEKEEGEEGGGGGLDDDLQGHHNKVAESKTENKEEKSGNGKSQEEFIDETVKKLLNKAGKHMEDTLIASYLTLIIGYLILDEKDYESQIRALLPDQNFGIMVAVLKKFYNFMNLTASSTVTSNRGLKATEMILKHLESLDKKSEKDESGAAGSSSSAAAANASGGLKSEAENFDDLTIFDMSKDEDETDNEASFNQTSTSGYGLGNSGGGGGGSGHTSSSNNLFDSNTQFGKLF